MVMVDENEAGEILEELIEKAQRGQEVLITRKGLPVAVIVPISTPLPAEEQPAPPTT